MQLYRSVVQLAYHVMLIGVLLRITHPSIPMTLRLYQVCPRVLRRILWQSIIRYDPRVYALLLARRVLIQSENHARA